MRLFALLFSLYLTCLSCLPCTDDGPVGVGQAQTSIGASSHPESGRNLGDWCSPLCQCQCCAGVVLAAFGTTLPTSPAAGQWVASRRHALLVVAAPTAATGAVWQPPQV